MTILRERKVWRRAPSAVRREFEKTWKLSDGQCRNVLAALAVVRVRFTSWAQLAKAMGIHKRCLCHVVRGPTKPNAG
ncbi:MAG TPA: hypothetical protein VF989_08635, partial [Polyangiaceae bacterium]